MRLNEEREIKELKTRLLNHDIYHSLNTVESLQRFMEYHVFAVWDFMSLAKRLQMDLTHVQLPWCPPVDSEQARFINEIILGEETDEHYIQGKHISHFELYLEAMEECGADTQPIRKFVKKVQSGMSIRLTLRELEVDPTISQFVEYSIELAMNGSTHEVCAAFFYGRENIIPDMFRVLIQGLRASGRKAEGLIYYLNRHIELDGDHHGPMVEKMLNQLCGESKQKQKDAKNVAIESLSRRIILWDGVMSEVATEV